jgi:voltage-gated potassium channel Kch
MMGLSYAICYTIMLEFSPEALNGIVAQHWTNNFSNTMYFSFVTLTTLGYGDISPGTRLAEVIVILESITGLFYMAIIVASLIVGIKRN